MQHSRKVVLVGPISPFKGGISAFNTSLSNELSRSGHDVHSIAWYNGMAGVSRDEQIDPSMPEQDNAHYLLKWYSPWSWFRAAIQSASYYPDMLIAHWTLPEVAPMYAVINSTLKRLSPNSKIVYIVHNVNPHEPHIGAGYLQKLGFRNVSCFMVHAHSEKNNLSNYVACHRIINGFHPIYDRYLEQSQSANVSAIDAQLVTWLAEKPDRPVLLFFGFVKPYKGLDLLLQALNRFDEALLIVAGQVSNACKPLRDQAKISNMGKRIFWMDRYIAEEQVPEIFSRADIVALPYRSCTQSGVACLAFAFDVPVVATDIGGLSESVDNGLTGYIVPGGDWCAFAQALKRAYSKRDYLRKGISMVKEKNSWSRYCEMLLSCLK